MTWEPLVQSAVILFAIVNPVGSIPLFLQLTNHLEEPQKRTTFRTAALTSAGILFIFALAGQGILSSIFRIQLPDLLAAGGLLLIIIAIDHLVFGSLMRTYMTGGGQEPEQIGAVPMACPILAGPGAMMTVLMTYAQFGFWTAAGAIVIVIALTWLVLITSGRIQSFLGRVACMVLSKMLCLFIAAIGFRMLMQGLGHYFGIKAVS